MWPNLQNGIPFRHVIFFFIKPLMNPKCCFWLAVDCFSSIRYMRDNIRGYQLQSSIVKQWWLQEERRPWALVNITSLKYNSQRWLQTSITPYWDANWGENQVLLVELSKELNYEPSVWLNVIWLGLFQLNQKLAPGYLDIYSITSLDNL